MLNRVFANQPSYRRDRITPWYEVSFATRRNDPLVLFLSELAIERLFVRSNLSLGVPRAWNGEPFPSGHSR